MEQTAHEVITIAEQYPSPPPNTSYQRTFELARAWQRARASMYTVSGIRGDLVTVFGVNAVDGRGKRYAAWVHGGFYRGQKVDQQEQHAATGWINVPQLVAAKRVAFLAKTRAFYREYANRANRRR